MKAVEGTIDVIRRPSMAIGASMAIHPDKPSGKQMGCQPPLSKLLFAALTTARSLKASLRPKALDAG